MRSIFVTVTACDNFIDQVAAANHPHLGFQGLRCQSIDADELSARIFINLRSALIEKVVAPRP